MIIELFGPPAAGKTTLAHALRAALTGQGLPVHLQASARPAERQPRAGSVSGAELLPATLARLGKGMSLVSSLLRERRDNATSEVLLRMLPPRHLTDRLRYRRYLSNLDAAWTKAATEPAVTIFDQAYASALSSLLLLAGPEVRPRAGEVIDLLPRPDLLVCLIAPRDVLLARLERRLGQQGRLERLFELDLEENLRQLRIVEEVFGMMAERGWPAIALTSIDDGSLGNGVSTVVKEVWSALDLLPSEQAA